MLFCRRVSLGRYSRGTEMFGKYFSWRSNSSFWARSRTFSLEVKMRSHGFQASTKHSHPRQPGSAFRISWTFSSCRRIRFEVLEKGVLCPVIHLLVINGGVAESLVRHFFGDWRWLPLVTTADDMDAATLKTVKEDLRRGAGYRAYLVPDDHPANELLPHPFGVHSFWPLQPKL